MFNGGARSLASTHATDCGTSLAKDNWIQGSVASGQQNAKEPEMCAGGAAACQSISACGPAPSFHGAGVCCRQLVGQNIALRPPP